MGQCWATTAQGTRCQNGGAWVVNGQWWCRAHTRREVGRGTLDAQLDAQLDAWLRANPIRRAA
jgi:hypothetical protein